jgi:hypothetical protein
MTRNNGYNPYRDELEKRPDEELVKMFLHPEDYGEAFVALVPEILIERGIDVEGLTASAGARQEHEGKHGSFIVLGYLLSLGLIGLFIGLTYATATVQTPDGAFPKYDESTRKAGRNMLIIFSLSLVYAIIRWTNDI